ncbi:MAG TPA: HU family DNA-binding protein [Thermoanaerobaculia bacterium]|nr:HU family DNA-binding protein [Thermoanaerobaculia bacterium]HUM31258.1 HU family DNA-binding protein [Thermoanaerobaculia bacterium]HXK69615.1 HU family DNA-binding protein [Thermoanaerobaculia bacterium]
MTKAELVEIVAKEAGISKKDAEVIVKSVIDSIVSALNQGEKVEIRGFGSFRIRERRARNARNPRTGKPIKVPSKKVPYFKPGKELRTILNQ